MAVHNADPGILELLDEVDRLAGPWKPERWRSGPDGLPVLADSIELYRRVVSGSHPVRLVVLVDRSGLFSVRDLSGYFDGLSLEEAVLRMLLDALQRTCSSCEVWDGHDATCVWWRTPDGQARLDPGAEHLCPDQSLFDSPLGIIERWTGGRIGCRRCGWPFIRWASAR